MTASKTKAGFVAIIGAPNAGKSTLFNQLLGQKLAIATPKAQTTRFNIRGIVTQNECQFILVDTPGIHKPRRDLDKAMVEAAHGAWAEADATLMLIDASRGITEEVSKILKTIKDCKNPLILALNKVDKVKPREKMLPLMQKINELGMFKQVFAISALNGDGTKQIFEKLAEYLPESPYLYSPDDFTDLSNDLIAAEITREQIFLQLREELPYSVMVATDSFQRQQDGSIKIHQSVLVQRDGQKQIIVGKGGSMIKKVGERARKELEDMFELKVHLFLKVKVREKWDTNPQNFYSMGLEIPKK